MSLQQLQVAGREAEPGHVGVVDSNGTARVLAVRVPAHRPRPGVSGHGGVTAQAGDGARHPEGRVEVHHGGGQGGSEGAQR